MEQLVMQGNQLGVYEYCARRITTEGSKQQPRVKLVNCIAIGKSETCEAGYCRPSTLAAKPVRAFRRPISL